MRRVALTVAGAALLCALAMAAPSSQPTSARAVGPSPAQPHEVDLYLRPDDAHHMETFPNDPGPSTWTAGRTVVYWGRFTNSPGTATSAVMGSYRATCIWLAEKHWPHSAKHKQDNRLSCNVVIGFKPRDGQLSGLVLQGLVKRPEDDGQLFAKGFNREVAVTGGTGEYKGAQGYADVSGDWAILIHYGLAKP
jgi:hypothetical protein